MVLTRFLFIIRGERMKIKVTIIESVRLCAAVAKNYTISLVSQLAETVAGALEELEGKLKQVAYTGSYNDLSDTPESLKNPNSFTLTVNGTATTYDGSVAKSKAIYAPTSYGTSGYSLVGSGSGGTPAWQPPRYVTCSTAAATTAKTASLTNFKLVSGIDVRVKFTYAHSGTTAATLNINSTGAKTIVVNVNGTNTNVKSGFTWSAGEIVTFTYNGTYWVATESDMGFIHPTNADMKAKADKASSVDVTIPVSGWSTDTSVGKYPYYYDISDSTVTSNDFAKVMIAPNSQDAASACGLCPTNETLAGKIRLRSVNIPTQAIVAEYRIEQGKET